MDRPAPKYLGETMKNLKWWQWCLIVFLGIPLIGATIDVLRSGSSSHASSAKAEFKALSGNAVFAMLVDPEVDPETLPDLAREHCSDREFCNVLGWVDEEFVAKGFPLTDRESAEVKFQYTVNRSTGLEQTLWDCRTWKRSKENNCLSVE